MFILRYYAGVLGNHGRSRVVEVSFRDGDRELPPGLGQYKLRMNQ